MRRLCERMSFTLFFQFLPTAKSFRTKLQDIARLNPWYRGRKCSDRRDYVYALRSLKKSPELHDSIPDYAINEAKIFVCLCVVKLSS